MLLRVHDDPGRQCHTHWQPHLASAGASLDKRARRASAANGILLLGNYRPALTVARSLSRHGHHIVMGLGGGEGCTEYSRFVDESWDHPPLSTAKDAFLASLLTLLDARRDISVIYPVAEEFVSFLAEHENALPKETLIASPPGDIVRSCHDKLAMLDLVKRVGLGHLPYRRVTSFDDLLAAAHEIGFPVVVRPLDKPTWFGAKKALIIWDGDELRVLCLGGLNGSAELLVQGYAAGERKDVFFAARAGQVLRAMQMGYLRTDQLDGTGLCVQGEIEEVDEVLLAQCRKLIRALGYTGIGCVQFVVEPVSKTICFIELNPRTSAVHRAPETVGMELSRLAIALAGGHVPAELCEVFRYEPGQRVAWTYGEIRGIKSALRRREIGPLGAIRWLAQAIRSAINADFHLTWRGDDPLPTIMLFLRQIGIRIPRRRRDDAALTMAKASTP